MSGYDPEHRASAVVVVVKKGKVLLLKRGKSDPWMPGKWCFPGGGIDRGEGPFEGALREVYEEAGLVLQVHDILPVGMVEKGRTTVYIFIAKAPRSKVRLLDGEHSDFRWVSPDALHSLRTIPLVNPILRSISTNGRSRSSSETGTFWLNYPRR